MPLKINLISDLDENHRLETITTANQVYAWFLRKAFVENGVDARLVRESKILTEMPPKADHTIIISSVASYLQKDVEYIQKLKSSTAGKLTCYMNINKLKIGDRRFDYCFTQIEPRSRRPKKYVCVGWGVDPHYSYPDQNEKAAFLDSKVLYSQRMEKKARKVYQIYDSVLPKLDMKVYNPVPIYNESERLPYLDYQAILRKCHYFLCTQFGEGGLNRLEAAACGALLVVPAKLYRKRTMQLLNHRLWHTKEELIEVLNEDVNIEANRQRALEHRWEDVVKNIVGVLEK